MTSPARMKRREHLGRARQAEENAAAHRVRYDKVLDGEERASALERQRECGLAALDHLEAELIAGDESWVPTDEQRQARRVAEENLAAARRAVRAIRQHAELLRAPWEEAQRAVAKLTAETAGRVDDVLAEEGDAAVAALAQARAEVIRLEAATRSISQALAARRSFRHAEVIAVAVNTMPWPDAQPNPAPYLALAERLAVDPDAVLP
jgi:phosphoglycolate phosphatase-like HAD superfamily hydrolase